MAGRSLLQSIRERELEASVELDAARREAAELIEAAKREAAAILGEAEREAAREAEEYTRREMEGISRVAAEMRERELTRAKDTIAAGERYVEVAAGRITRAVIPE